MSEQTDYEVLKNLIEGDSGYWDDVDVDKAVERILAAGFTRQPQPHVVECRNTGWLITAATCPHCKGSGRADSIQGAAECGWCGGCGHVCDDSATRPTASEPTEAQGEDR